MDTESNMLSLRLVFYYLMNSYERGLDLNQRPSGHEPDKLPRCSTSHDQREMTVLYKKIKQRQIILGYIASNFALYSFYLSNLI